MAKYTMLFFDSAKARADIAMSEWRELAQAHAAYRERLTGAGAVVLDHVVLEPDFRTRTAEYAGGDLLGVTDGPMTAADPVLGGFYLVEVPDSVPVTDLLDRAPLPRGTGHVELRPVV